jgi:EmrB/QacA subfamily drug resistance transporter
MTEKQMMVDEEGRPISAFQAGAIQSRRWFGLAILLAGVFVATLDSFIVFLAVPSIQTNLKASFSQIELIVAGYTLAFAVGLITSGRLGDGIGRRRMFLIGFAAFTVASGLCGVAQSANALIVFRVVQGLSAALLTPQVLAMIRVMFVGRERAVAFAWLGVVMGVAAVAGQVVGGLIIAGDIWGLEWRPVFLLNVPVGIFALIAGRLVLAESRVDETQRLDWVGVFLSSLGLGTLLYPLVEGREAGWPAWCVRMLFVSVLVLIGFVVHQRWMTRRDASPLMDTDLYRNRAFTVGIIVVLVFFGAIGPMLLSLTYLLQLGFARSPLEAALDFSPMAVAFAITSFITGRLTNVSARAMLMGGAIAVAAGAMIAYDICTFTSFRDPMVLLPALISLGLGQGLFMTPVMNVVLSNIEDRHTGAASGVLATVQRVGTALGVAILEIPFFAAVEHARSGGADQGSAYAVGFASVMGWVVAMMSLVLIMLFFLRGSSHVESNLTTEAAG